MARPGAASGVPDKGVDPASIPGCRPPSTPTPSCLSPKSLQRPIVPRSGRGASILVTIASSSSRPVVRAIIAELSAFQAGIVRNALARGGIEIAAEVDDAAAVADMVDATQSQLVIIPASGAGIASHYHHLLTAHPAVRLITLSVTFGRADLLEVRLVGSDVGSSDMVEAIRIALGAHVEDALQSTREEEIP